MTGIPLRVLAALLVAAFGLAFLGATLEVKAPTRVGDTIHVEAEVIEHRLTSKGDRGLVRFHNRVVNQRGEIVLEYNPLRLLKRK
jgi:acyl dehydratase